MSNATTPTLQPPADATAESARRTSVEAALHSSLRTVLSGVRAAAFWAAVLLPLVTILLVSSGVVAGSLAMLALVAANVACAIVGHDYSRYP